MSQRIIFLDVDGVLNNVHTWKRPYWIDGTKQEGTYMLDPHNVAQFLGVRAELNLTIVLSSTWRTHADHVTYLQECGIFGIGAAPIGAMGPWGHADWRTPAHFSSIRGREIAEWLEDHPKIGPTDYAIVDDDSDMLPTQRARFIQTSWQSGFGPRHADKLRRLPWTVGQSAALPIGNQSDTPLIVK